MHESKLSQSIIQLIQFFTNYYQSNHHKEFLQTFITEVIWNNAFKLLSEKSFQTILKNYYQRNHLRQLHPAADGNFVICRNPPCRQVLALSSWRLVHPEADDDFVICRNTIYGQVLVLPSWCLLHPAADDDFVICQNAPYGQVLVLWSQCLVGPAADDDFVICWNTPHGQAIVLPSGHLVHPAADDDFVYYQRNYSKQFLQTFITEIIPNNAFKLSKVVLSIYYQRNHSKQFLQTITREIIQKNAYLLWHTLQTMLKTGLPLKKILHVWLWHAKTTFYCYGVRL